MTIRSTRARRGLGICLIALSWLVSTREHVVGDEPKSPRVVIVVANEAPRLERFAASELQSILSRLFEANVTVRPKAVEGAAALILIGRPVTNPVLREAVGKRWPKLTDQGLVLRRLDAERPMLVVGGAMAYTTNPRSMSARVRWVLRRRRSYRTSSGPKQ